MRWTRLPEHADHPFALAVEPRDRHDERVKGCDECGGKPFHQLGCRQLTTALLLVGVFIGLLTFGLSLRLIVGGSTGNLPVGWGLTVFFLGYWALSRSRSQVPISGVPRDHARGKPEGAGLVPIAQFGAAAGVHTADASGQADWYRRVAPRRWLGAAAKRALDMTMKEMTLTVS